MKQGVWNWITGADKKSDATVRAAVSTTPRTTATIDFDAPVQDAAHDRFDRAPFAFRIAETLIGRTDPASLAIAIYGAWGDGKTTVLNFPREAQIRTLGGLREF